MSIDFNQALINARPLVLAVIHRTGIKDRATAEDVAQDAFIKAWQSASKESTTFRSESKVSSWLCSIAKNAAIDHMRKHHKMVMLGDKAIPEKASYKYNPETNLIKAERNKAIEANVMVGRIWDFVEDFVHGRKVLAGSACLCSALRQQR